MCLLQMSANFIHHYLVRNKFMNTAGSGFRLFALSTSELLNRLIKTTAYVPETLWSFPITHCCKHFITVNTSPPPFCITDSPN